MDKGNAMTTGFERHIKASLGLLLLTVLVTGCVGPTRGSGPLVGEVIPAQTCGGNIDSDGDGVMECDDRCPGTLRGEAVDPEGCPLPVMEPKPFRG